MFLNFRKENADEYIIEIKDDGIGIAPHITTKNSPSLGLQLVDMLTEQIGGTIEIDDAWRLGIDHIAVATGAGKPTIVIIGSKAARSAWRIITVRSLKPLARAVRM